MLNRQGRRHCDRRRRHDVYYRQRVSAQSVSTRSRCSGMYRKIAIFHRASAIGITSSGDGRYLICSARCGPSADAYCGYSATIRLEWRYVNSPTVSGLLTLRRRKKSPEIIRPSSSRRSSAVTQQTVLRQRLAE